MFQKILRFLSVLDYSNLWNRYKMTVRAKSLTENFQTIAKLNNETVLEFRRTRASIITGVLALLGLLAGYSKDPLILKSVPFFMGFVVFGIFSLLLDYHHDIRTFEKKMKALLDHQKTVNSALDLIKKLAFGRDEADELNKEILGFKLPRSPVLLLIKNLCYLVSWISLIIGAYLLLVAVFKIYG